MKKKQWIIGIIIIGIIVAICAFSCSLNNDEYQSMEDETEFVPFPSEEDAEDENVSDDLEEGEKSSSDKSEEKKNPVSDTVQNGNDTASDTTENKNDKDSNATTDNGEQDSEDTGDTGNNVDTENTVETELPFVPFE